MEVLWKIWEGFWRGFWDIVWSLFGEGCLTVLGNALEENNVEQQYNTDNNAPDYQEHSFLYSLM